MVFTVTCIVHFLNNYNLLRNIQAKALPLTTIIAMGSHSCQAKYAVMLQGIWNVDSVNFHSTSVLPNYFLQNF